MTTIAYTPSFPLNSYVDRICYIDDPAPYPSERILPSPSLDLKINLGGHWTAYKSDLSESATVCDSSWLVGLWSTSHVVDWPQDVQVFIVYFKSAGAYPFLQIPLSELHNQIVSLDLLWENFATEIRERLSAAPSIKDGFALLEEFLLSRLCFAPHGLNIVQYAITEIARQHGALSIRELSDHIGVSQKHLIHQFKRMVGGTPKEVARLYRFQHVLYTINPVQPVDWTWLAHRSQYYDQSHFYKDFEELSGHGPADYLRLRRQVHSENPIRSKNLRLLPLDQPVTA